MASGKTKIRVFFSHKYEAFAVNYYFYGLLTEGNWEIQFEVDEGRQDGKPIPSNVTRIERKIRNASAFVGVYPLPEDAPADPDDDYLRLQSRYFRFELDIARRIGVPIIVFCDQRFGGGLRPSPSVAYETFDSREVPDDVTIVALDDFKTAISDFYAATDRWIRGTRRRVDGKRVGMILNSADYGSDTQKLLSKTLKGWELEPLPWPPQLQLQDYSQLERFDWLLVDSGPAASATGIVPYLHARGVPAMRIRRVSSGQDPERSEAEAMMFGGLEVGYADPRKEVRWENATAVGRGDDINASLAHARFDAHQEQRTRRAVLPASRRREGQCLLELLGC